MTGSLDPEDWGAFRALCHTAVDDMVDWWEGVRARPVWQPMPEAAKAALIGPPPRSGQEPQDVYRRFVELVLPYPNGNTHPGFMGWVHGSGTPIGALAEFLAGALNANLGGREHADVYVERQVIDWARQLALQVRRYRRGKPLAIGGRGRIPVRRLSRPWHSRT